MAGRQLGTFLLLGLGVGLGFAAVDAMFGQRKIVVKDSYPTPQQPAYAPPPSPQSVPTGSSLPYSPASSTPYPSFPSQSSADCYTALTALSDCESRNGYGSDKCRFFRQKAEECQQQQAAHFAGQTAEQR